MSLARIAAQAALRYPSASLVQRAAKAAEEAAELLKAAATQADPKGYGQPPGYEPDPRKEWADLGIVWASIGHVLGVRDFEAALAARMAERKPGR